MLVPPDFLSLISPVFVKPKFIALGTTLKRSHSGVVFCFLHTSFCILLLVVLPRICARHSSPPQNIIKRTADVFLTGDPAAMERTDNEVSGQSVEHQRAHTLLLFTGQKKVTTQTSRNQKGEYRWCYSEKSFLNCLNVQNFRKDS